MAALSNAVTPRARGGIWPSGRSACRRPQPPQVQAYPPPRVQLYHPGGVGKVCADLTRLAGSIPQADDDALLSDREAYLVEKYR